MSLSIGKIAPSHLTACASVDGACTLPAERWSFSDFADFLARPGHGALVALGEQRVVGFVVYRADRAGRRLHLVRIGVAPRWQRRRIGTRMVNQLRDGLRAVPDVTLGALVPERRLDLQCFLRTVGFRAVRVCPGCFGNGDDGYWFESPVLTVQPATICRAER